MDIDDILASVSGPNSSALEAQDLQALTRAWVAERSANEVLPYPSELIERMSARISKQISNIETLTSAMDPTSNFSLIVIQTELERVKFLLRSLLRCRIAKLDRYALHYLSLYRTQTQSDSQSEDPRRKCPLLSEMEARYLQHHTALLGRHYASSFLSGFPAQLQRLDDTAGGISMVDKPDEEVAVFVKVLRDAGVVEVQGEQGVGEVEMRRGDVWVLRWKSVRGRVVRGDLELL